MSFDSFISRAGFRGDPFAHTNSEQETLLSKYFVPPPYFEAVLGTPQTPKTNVIFAPRGTGKTAQRLMIEKRSETAELPFLCLTYSSFASVTKLGGTLNAHHIELCRLLTIAILVRLEESSIWINELNAHDKEVVKVATRTFLGHLSAGDYETAFRSVKTPGDKMGELWKKYGGVVAAGIAVLMKKAGLDDVQVSVTLEQEAEKVNTDGPRYFWDALVSITAKLGYRAVYFLVDKVDEAKGSGIDSKVAADLIAELVTDLPTLEHPGVAFKFFLWDQMRQHLLADGLRGDRMEVIRFTWTHAELSDMLSRRLKTFSAEKIQSFNDLMEPDCPIDVHLLLVHLSNGSPRDVIRMARSIVTEHTRVENAAEKISLRTVYRSVHDFSVERVQESFAKYSKDFAKVPEPSFVVGDLTKVFKHSPTGVSNKIQAWVASGAVVSLGTRANPGAKPPHLYGFADLRIVLAYRPLPDTELVLDNFALQCPDCQTWIVTGEAETSCPSCGSDVMLGNARSLFDFCRRSSA